MTLDELRAELPLVEQLAYFQTGSAGPTPNSVLQLLHDMLLFTNHNGPASPDTQAVLRQQESVAKQGLADFLQVKTAELAWMPNTSQALHKVLHAVDWQPGDEFVVTSAEHVSVQGACQALAKNRGVAIKMIPADDGDDKLLTALEAALTARTKLVCMSEVASMNGRLLPIRAAIQIAHAHGVPVLADVAQSVGQRQVNLAEMGCDFAIGSLHKWMLGSKGLGFLYVNESRIPTFIPDFIPDYHPWTKPDQPLPPIDAASRADQGIYDHAIRISVQRTIEILGGIGMAQIEAHCRQLTTFFCNEVANWPGVNLVSPSEPALQTGLCCLNFADYSEQRVRGLIAQLLAERLVVKYQPEPNGIRLSFAAFNTVAEVERLLAGLRRFI